MNEVVETTGLSEESISESIDPILEVMDRVDIIRLLKNTIVSTDLPIPRRTKKENLFAQDEKTGIHLRNVTLEDLLKYQLVRAGRRLFDLEKPVEVTMKLLLEMDKECRVQDNIMSIETSADVVLSKLPKEAAKTPSYVSGTGMVLLEDPRVQMTLFEEKISRRTKK